MQVERENTFSFMYVLGSGSSDTYNTCLLHSHVWLVRLIRATVPHYLLLYLDTVIADKAVA